MRAIMPAGERGSVEIAQIGIEREEDHLWVENRVRWLAQELGFSKTQQEDLATAAGALASRVHQELGRGRLTVAVRRGAHRLGLEVICSPVAGPQAALTPTGWPVDSPLGAWELEQHRRVVRWLNGGTVSDEQVAAL
ncbi:MAG: hypothetical protein HY335_07515, partial [Deinococcus sp.]|nr:hypothetical protein [Deinococcus sp.]